MSDVRTMKRAFKGGRLPRPTTLLGSEAAETLLSARPPWVRTNPVGVLFTWRERTGRNREADRKRWDIATPVHGGGRQRLQGSLFTFVCPPQNRTLVGI